jgi:hypothetical protein
MPGGATALYFGMEGSSIPLVNIEATFTENWIIQFSCFHPIRQGTFDVSLDDLEKTVILMGEFIDVDEDNCADKIFLKDADKSYGYPYYL